GALSQMTSIRDTQVVIVGGGPAGSVTAMVLARAGRRVLLVEESVGEADRVGEAIPPAARPLLRRLGLLERLPAAGHLPCYGNRSVWGSDEPYSTDFILDPNGHGWHLDRRRFDAMLRDAARSAGAEVLRGLRPSEATRDGVGCWRIGLRGDREAETTVGCDWLVGATGRRAPMAAPPGAPRRRDDGLVAFHARFRPATGAVEDRDSRTTVEAVSDGWWYTALVPDGERVVAFLTDADLADRPALLSASGFGDRLTGAR